MHGWTRTFIVTAALLIPAHDVGAQVRFNVPESQGARWWKGNTHVHTLESDGDSPPDTVAHWYKSRGYNFLVITDHNVLVDPQRFASFNDSSFLLVRGEEVTSTYQAKAVHVNGLNLDALVPPVRDSTLLGTVQKSVDAIRAVNGVPHINHPNFMWAIDAETLFRVRNDRLIEIFNGHPLVHNVGGGDWPGMEEVWDLLLTRGKRIYGLATDDAHHFKVMAPEMANPGKGWVVVRSNTLSAAELMRRMEAGQFYASTGVELDDIVVTANTMTVKIRERSSFKYTTEFIGPEGVVLHRTGANPALYELQGNPSYVRAKVIDSGGAIAWIQPVFTTR